MKAREFRLIKRNRNNRDDFNIQVCHPGNALRCAVGDLTSKAGIRISVAAKRGAILNKFYYTDVNLPLSGPHSVLHR